MGQVLGLKFRDHGQIYYFDSGPFVVQEGDHVIVKTEQGMGLGWVSVIREEAPADVEDRELKGIFRLATEEDLKVQDENEELAAKARKYCKRCIEERGLEMKLVDVEVYFDRSKVVFYFTAPGRIDFRELVKDLVREYRTRIELRQIGVRHETQMLGAVGNCGQVTCCKRFMHKFEPVTIKMAKEQNLFLNPTKISGICGRLLCCLAFEEENYEQFYCRCPKVGKRLQTDNGVYKVLRANFFRGTLSLFSELGEEVEMPLEEWQALHPRPCSAQEFQRREDEGPGPEETSEPEQPEMLLEENGDLVSEDRPVSEPAEQPARKPEDDSQPKAKGEGEGGGEREQQGRPRGKGPRQKRRPRKKSGKKSLKGKGGKGK